MSCAGSKMLVCSDRHTKSETQLMGLYHSFSPSQAEPEHTDTFTRSPENPHWSQPPFYYSNLHFGPAGD